MELLNQVSAGAVSQTKSVDLVKEFESLAKEISAGFSGKPPTSEEVLQATIDAFNVEDFTGLSRNATMTGTSDSELESRGKKIIYWFKLIPS